MQPHEPAVGNALFSLALIAALAIACTLIECGRDAVRRRLKGTQGKPDGRRAPLAGGDGRGPLVSRDGLPTWRGVPFRPR